MDKPQPMCNHCPFVSINIAIFNQTIANHGYSTWQLQQLNTYLEGVISKAEGSRFTNVTFSINNLKRIQDKIDQYAVGQLKITNEIEAQFTLMREYVGTLQARENIYCEIINKSVRTKQTSNYNNDEASNKL